jgi:hypothetical protein
VGRLEPEKLFVKYLAGADRENFLLPRRYTLTHSDRTGNLFLSIGDQYDTKEISKLYTRLMRDEVLAEFVKIENKLEFRVYCHVSGGFVVGTAGWRYNIFRSELPLALEAIRYGDRGLFEKNPELDHVPVNIYFRSRNKKYNIVESWGSLADYADRGKVPAPG